ncbi:MAG: glycosyl transferase [Bacteroidia bacterium]|nr:glycosyl transferase [Bacteroidia bacterium]
MKILYAVQATGNGHISRAAEIIPLLQTYGQVDVMLSGNNAHLPVQLPVKYRSNGISLFYRHGGGLNYKKMIQQFNPLQLWKDIKNLPVEQYDLVINDFDFITAMACKLKRVFSVQIGHQASFQYAASPRPTVKNRIGELILKQFAPASHYIGLHFQSYHPNILPPIIGQSIRSAIPTNQGHITVYLAQYSLDELLRQFKSLTHLRFHIFSAEVSKQHQQHNCTLFPLGKETFSHSMIHAQGIITGGGFETPAEALFLGKKIMSIPIKGQYEQFCNAEALKSLGAKVLSDIDIHFGAEVDRYFDGQPINKPKSLEFWNNKTIVDNFMAMALKAKSKRPDQDTELPGATLFDGLMNTNFPSASSAINIMP